jgi:hypothetical protein
MKDGVWVNTTATVVINTAIAPGLWVYTSVLQNARTIIHELGHVFNVVSGLGSSDIELDTFDGKPDRAAQARNRTRLEVCVPTVPIQP